MTSAWEITAVLLALAYLALAIRQSPWCWPAAIASTTIYIFLMYNAGLYMESALQLFYIAIAIYGWRQWTAGSGGIHGPGRSGFSRDKTTTGGDPSLASLPVTTWPWSYHAIAIIAVLTAAAASGALLSRYTEAALPYADSFTTWGAIVTTWMVARKILENWIYWFVIDSVSVFLYVSRELYLTAGLFVVYLILVVVGYITWRKSMHSPRQELPA